MVVSIISFSIHVWQLNHPNFLVLRILISGAQVLILRLFRTTYLFGAIALLNVRQPSISQKACALTDFLSDLASVNLYLQLLRYLRLIFLLSNFDFICIKYFYLRSFHFFINNLKFTFYQICTASGELWAQSISAFEKVIPSFFGFFCW